MNATIRFRTSPLARPVLALLAGALLLTAAPVTVADAKPKAGTQDSHQPFGGFGRKNR